MTQPNGSERDPWDGTDEQQDDDALAYNYIDDDGEMACGICGRAVRPDGLCADCDGVGDGPVDDVEANTDGDIA